MKILLVVPGHLKTVPMSRFCAKALSDLGHEVHVENYHADFLDKIKSKIGSFLGDDELSLGVNKRIRSRISKIKPDLLFTIYGLPISKKTLDYSRSLGVVNACWWINDPFQFERGLKLAVNYDLWFSNSSECARQVEEALGVRSYFLPTACEPAVHHPAPIDSRFSCDICFAGDWCAARQELVEFLISKGFDVRIFGPWQKKLPVDSKLHQHLVPGFFTPEQMTVYFSSAKIVLNYHTWYGKFTHGVNPRLFEAASCRTLQVVDYKEEIPDLFKVDKEIIVYNEISELPELLENLLANTEMRNSIADSAYKRAISDHTYQARMKEMLNSI